MAAEFLVFLALPVILALAAGWDLASYTIPNGLSLALIASFVAFGVIAGLPAAAFGGHLAAGLVGLAIGFALFAGGLVGGGDAKLFAATALWFGFADLGSYALTATVAGGVLTIAIMMLRRIELPVVLKRVPWLVRLHDARSGIPYGVALAAGALAVLPQTQIFRLLAVA